MKRALLVLAATSLAVGGPSLADAASGQSAATSHKKKNHALHLSVSIVGVSPEGRPPISGVQNYVGTADGSLGGAREHGAVRGVNTYNITTFSGSNTTFAAGGSTTQTLKGSGTLAADGTETFSGTGTVIRGTGIYKGATGTFTFSGSLPKTSTVSTFTVTGKVKY